MYNYSTDYEKLWELCQNSKRPACIVNGEIFFHERSNLDKQTAISIWEEDCLRWIDPQPVQNAVKLSQHPVQNAVKLSQQYLDFLESEKVESMERWMKCRDDNDFNDAQVCNAIAEAFKAAKDMATEMLHQTQQPSERVFYIDEIGRLLIRLYRNEISLSKFVELLNEKATDLTGLQLFKLSAAYNLSTDYERLWELIFKGGRPLYTLDGYEFTPWVTPLEGESKESIIERFTKAKLQWINPQPASPKPVEEKKKFTMQDFEKGLMLAGKVEPKNETEAREKALLDAYERGQQSIIEKLKGLPDSYKKWCKETERNGGVLIGKSIKEFHSWFIEAIINQSK